MFIKQGFFALAIAGIAAVVLVGCQKAKAPAEPFVAQVGDSTITAAQWKREVEKHPNLNAEQREAAFQELLRNEILWVKARQSGFDRDPEIQDRVKRLIATAYLEKLKGPESTKANSPAELQEYYAAHANEFGVGERVHVAGILLRAPQKATDEKKKELAERAQAALAKAQANQGSAAGFGDLAREISEDQSSRYQGGDMGWFTRGEMESRWNKAVADAVFGLKEARDLSGVVAAPGGFYIFKLIERQTSRVKTLDEVKDLAAFRLGREKEARAARELDEKLKAGMKIEINHALVDQISATQTNAVGAPPAMPVQ